MEPFGNDKGTLIQPVTAHLRSQPPILLSGREQKETGGSSKGDKGLATEQSLGRGAEEAGA